MRVDIAKAARPAIADTTDTTGSWSVIWCGHVFAQGLLEYQAKIIAKRLTHLLDYMCFGEFNFAELALAVADFAAKNTAGATDPLIATFP